MSLPKMPNYANNKNYLLWSDNLPYDQLYVGHTTDPIEKRLERHERNLDCTARRIIEAGSYHIRVLEEWPCKNKKEALWRERWWFENTPCINKNLPIQTHEEYLEYNRQLSKKNWEKNGDKLRAEMRIRARENVNCGICFCSTQKGHKGRHTNTCYTQFCKAFDIDADFKGIKGGITSE